MKKTLFGLLLSCAFAAISAQATLNPTSGNTLSPILTKAMPAIVNISVRGQLPPIQVPIGPGFGPGGKQPKVEVTPRFEGLGSGVVIDAINGYIITNAHVLKEAKIIVITLNDGRKLQGKLLGVDEPSDVALIQINAKHLTQVPFGDSDELKVGDFVAAIGNPFGLNQTVTSGVVSALGRADLGIEGYEYFIQTDAPINPGNSGGALIDMQGKLIGINTAIITPSPIGGSVGIGLAIPINMVKSVVDQIIKHGKVEHGLIGIMVQNITPALADAMKLKSTEGALIASVNPGSPAEKAGLKSGDIIIKLNGKNIHESSQVSTTIGLLPPGTAVTLEINSNGNTKTITATSVSLSKEREAMNSTTKPLLAGLALSDFNQLEDNQQIIGVEILDVDDFSVAYSCGIRPGDVIMFVNNQPVTNISQLQKMATDHPDSLLLKVRRQGEGVLFTVLER